jgi:hypothetical protein
LELVPTVAHSALWAITMVVVWEWKRKMEIFSPWRHSTRRPVEAISFILALSCLLFHSTTGLPIFHQTITYPDSLLSSPLCPGRVIHILSRPLGSNPRNLSTPWQVSIL